MIIKLSEPETFHRDYGVLSHLYFCANCHSNTCVYKSFVGLIIGVYIVVYCFWCRICCSI